MFPQIRLQRGMVPQEFFVIHQRRILAKLLGRFAVRVQELIEARHLLAVDVAITITITISIAIAIVFMAVEAGFLTHEGVRIVLDLLAHGRMILQISLQGRMLLHIVIVIDERRIFAQLIGEFGMAVQELVQVREFLAGSVVALKSWSILSGRRLRDYGRAKAQETGQS